MIASAVWKQDMTFIGTAKSGYPIQMDSDLEGTNSGPRPMELIEIGLAGCMGMDVLSILRKKRQKLTGFEVRVDAPRSPEYPKVFTRADVLIVIKGNEVNETALLRAIELSATKYCPVHFMLEQAFPIDIRYEIYEDEGEGNEHLIHQGAWQEMPPE